eukprot:2964936-Lingulodinium_polyedra.AAC.1
MMEHKANLEPLTKREAYFAACGEATKAAQIDKLGLEDPVGFVYDENLALRRAELLYTKIIDKARNKRNQEIENAQKEKIKNEQTEQDLANSKPADILQELVTDIVNRKLTESKDEMSDDSLESVQSPSVPAERF